MRNSHCITKQQSIEGMLPFTALYVASGANIGTDLHVVLVSKSLDGINQTLFKEGVVKNTEKNTEDHAHQILV
jgi:hypothetical protein